VKQQWRVHRHAEVTAYLISLREEGKAIRMAIESLKHGLPQDVTQTKPHTYIWFEAEHWLVLVLEEENHAIYVSMIQKAEEPPDQEELNIV
jgi:hypothetical protein